MRILPCLACFLLFYFYYHIGFDDGVLWDRYIWEGEVMDIEPYKDFNRKNSKSVFVPGVGCTVNSILDMKNINSTHGSIYDQEGLHRSQDPGVGAFAPYHGAQTTVVVPEIPAGAELFATYGDYWYVGFGSIFFFFFFFASLTIFTCTNNNY
jgi:hypothetical protein